MNPNVKEIYRRYFQCRQFEDPYSFQYWINQGHTSFEDPWKDTPLNIQISTIQISVK